MTKTKTCDAAVAKRGRKAKPDCERYRFDRAGNEIDWNTIERDFIAGILSIRAIASGANVADATVRRKAALEGWQRSLAPRVLARAENLMMCDIGKQYEESERRETQQKKGRVFSKKDSQALQTQALRARDKSASSYDEDDEQSAAGISAQKIIKVLHAHRQDIAKARQTVKDLMRELGTGSELSIRELLELALSPDCDEETRQVHLKLAIDRAISLASRASAVRDLMSALKVVITLERQALRVNEMSHDISSPAVPVNQPFVVPITLFDELFAKAKSNN